MRYLLGNTAQDAARSMRAAQDRLVERFAPVWENEIRTAWLEMTAAYEASRSMPVIPVEHEARMAEVWASMTSVAVNAMASLVLENGVKRLFPYTTDNCKTFHLLLGDGRPLETKNFAELFARLASEYITSEVIRRRITQVSGTLRQQVVNVILAGQAEGLTTAEIVKQLTVLSDSIPRYRADMIARTEIHGAANYGANEAARATGLKLRKEWVSVEDHRTRALFMDDQFDHRVMNEVTVDMDEPFMVPTRNGTLEPLMTPGDPNGSAGNIINCRCAVAHVVVD